MKRKLLVMVPLLLLGVSLLLNIYTIRIINDVQRQNNTRTSNVAGFIGEYGHDLNLYLENPSDSLHHRLDKFSNIHNFLNKGLDFRSLRRFNTSNYNVMEAVNRLSTRASLVESQLQQIRRNNEHDGGLLNEELGGETILLLQNYAESLMLFSRNVVEYYSLTNVDSSWGQNDNISGKSDKTKELEEKILDISEEIHTLLDKWFE